LESGKPWFSPLVEQLRTCDHLITIITRPEAFYNLWINFEIGVAFGDEKFSKVLVFGGVSCNSIPHPIGGLQLIDTGDSNRLYRDLKQIGIERAEEYRIEFAKLFRQCATT
jgi:hypothetical protein